MRWTLMLLFFLLMITPATCLAVTAPPPVGTVLPARLGTKLHSGMKPGSKIEATIMQDVPLPGGGKIRVGTKLSGHVVSVSEREIAIQFDSLRVKGNEVPVATSLRAIAGPLDIQEAETPVNVSERENSTFNGSTAQIGGEAAYRGADLMDGAQKVGKALGGGGALGPLRASSKGCEADPNVQALWVFSTIACGVYGPMDLSIAHNGKTTPLGQIVLRSDKEVLVRSGTGMMLRVVGSQP